MFFEKIKKMSLKEKIIFLGALLAFGGSFLPWFYDWPVGENSPVVVNGLHGWAFLSFLAAVFSLVYFLLPFLGQKQPKLGVTSEKFYYYCGIVIMTASVLDLLLRKNIGVSFGGPVVIFGGFLLAFPEKISKFFKQSK